MRRWNELRTAAVEGPTEREAVAVRFDGRAR
jgi:hypothetical protein